MRNAVFITSGIGNAIFLLPLIKDLFGKGKVTLFSSSSYHSEKVFEQISNPETKQIVSIKSAWKVVLSLVFHFQRFDNVYIDHFGASRRNLILAHYIGKRVVTSRIPANLDSRYRRKISLVTPIPGLHEGAQIMRYSNQNFSDLNLNESMFYIKTSGVLPKQISKSFITMQPGAGNDQTPWKVWPLGQWLELIKRVLTSHPNLQIVILGDKFDLQFAPYFEALGPNVLNLIDQTQLSEIPFLLSKSNLHIGGDSGLLHVAGAVGTKTITLCGGSDPELFGWHKIEPSKHLLIQHKLDCHPCYRYYLPNRSRVDNVINCPDFKCIRSIEVAQVASSLNQHLE